jgi:histidinol-phosphate aminotransferase
MNSYWNRRVLNLSPYVPGEQPGDGKFIKLNTNENPFPPSPRVIEAIKKAADEKLRLYPDPSCAEFREAAAARFHVRPEQVFAGNGSDEVLAFAFGAFFEGDGGPLPESAARGPGILFPDISYSFYPVYAGLWGLPCRAVPLDGDFSIRTGDYHIPSGGVVFPNPNAPTGRALPLEEILSLAKILEARKRVLILDEAYAAFGAESAVSRINEHPNLLTVHTLSKSASLAGLRVGFAVGSEELVEGLCRIRDSFNSYTVDRLALAGGAAAMRDSAWYDEINRRVIATRERVSAELSALGFTVIPSKANFVFTKPPEGPAFTGGAAFTEALRGRGILVRHFDKPRIADYLRVSVGTDGEMDLFLTACREIITRGKI